MVFTLAKNAKDPFGSWYGVFRLSDSNFLVVKAYGQILEQAKVTPYGFLQNFGIVEKSNLFNA